MGIGMGMGIGIRIRIRIRNPIRLCVEAHGTVPDPAGAPRQ